MEHFCDVQLRVHITTKGFLMDNICLNCFSDTGGYDVCPYCGFLSGTPNEPAFMLQPGMRIWGRYIIGSILGIGGFGVTYKAFDTRLSTVVAIKEFFPQNLASRMPNDSAIRVFSGEEMKSFNINKQRFVEEGKNLAKFTGDAHIVNVLDGFEDNGTAYIVMEFLDGVTLKQYLEQKGGTLPKETALAIMEGLLLGIQSIHIKGIIHRDISPDNIYILRDGSVKILDFGAARFAAKEEWTQSVVVKKGYAPPEQYRTNMKQTPMTDLYAAGATFYKVLTGKTPEESIERWERDLLRRPSAVNNEIDNELDRFVMKSMALKPELRFKSADLMLSALKGGGNYDFPEQEQKRRRRRRTIALVSSLVLLFAVFGVGGLLLSQDAPIVSAVITGEAPVVYIDDTLADMDISPGEVEMWIDEGADIALYNQLSSEFSELHPDYSVKIKQVQYEELNTYREVEDKSSVEGPTLTNISYLWDGEERADLSLLVAGLDEEEYYHYYFENDEGIPTVFYGLRPSIIYVPSAMINESAPYPISNIDDAFYYTERSNYLNYYEYVENILQLFTFYYPDTTFAQGEEFFFDLSPMRDSINEIIFNFIASYESEKFEGYVENRYDTVQKLSPYQADNSVAYIRGEIGQATTAIPFIRTTDEETLLMASGNNRLELEVNAASDENERLIAMTFIHFVLSERGQSILHIQNNNVMPVNRQSMTFYVEQYPEYSDILPYLENDFDYVYNHYRMFVDDMETFFVDLQQEFYELDFDSYNENPDVVDEFVTTKGQELISLMETSISQEYTVV